jgi:hypothetical protein
MTLPITLPGGGGSANYAVTSVTSNATPSVAATGLDMLLITAQAVNLTGITVTGTPANGYRLQVVIKDNGTTRTFAPGSSFQNSDSATAPGTTTVGKWHVLLYEYFASPGPAKYVLMSFTTF